MANLIINVTFSQLGDFEDTVGDGLRERKRAPQIRRYLVVEQPFQLKRHARQDEDNSSGIFNNERRRRAIRVFNRDRPFRNIRLAFIIGSHDKTTASKTLIELFQ